jgi:hypothetical protein
MRVGQFELAVLVGGAPLPELVSGAGDVFVETKFNVAGVSRHVVSKEARARRLRGAARRTRGGGSRRRRAHAHALRAPQTDPYGEAFEQSWPVTPYTLRVTNHTGDMARGARPRGRTQAYNTL